MKSAGDTFYEENTKKKQVYITKIGPFSYKNTKINASYPLIELLRA